MCVGVAACGGTPAPQRIRATNNAAAVNSVTSFAASLSIVCLMLFPYDNFLFGLPLARSPGSSYPFRLTTLQVSRHRLPVHGFPYPCREALLHTSFQMSIRLSQTVTTSPQIVGSLQNTPCGTYIPCCAAAFSSTKEERPSRPAERTPDYRSKRIDFFADLW